MNNSSSSIQQNIKIEKHKNLFECCLCNELVNPKKAKLMPCLHTICSPCEISADKTDDHLICAKCNQKWSVVDIVDNYLVRACYTNLTKCTSCCENLIAEFKCSECDDFLCMICSNAHKRVKLTKHHCLIQLNTICPTSEPCDKHNDKELDRFCLSCNDLACDKCQNEKHSGHLMQPLEERTSFCNKSLMNSLERLEQLSSLVDNFVNLADKHLKEVDSFESQIMDRLRFVMNEIETMCKQKRKPYLEMKHCSEIYSSSAKQVTSFVEATVGCPNKVIVHYVKDIIQSAFLRNWELFSTADSQRSCLETALNLPSLKQVFKQLIIDVDPLKDKLERTVEQVASGANNNRSPRSVSSKCSTPPARISSISPHVNVSHVQTSCSMEKTFETMPNYLLQKLQQMSANSPVARQTLQANCSFSTIPFPGSQTVQRAPPAYNNHSNPPMSSNATVPVLQTFSSNSATSTSRSMDLISPDQNVYAQQQSLSQTQFDQPLPHGWEMISNKGVPIFIDHVNKITTYLDPRLIKPPVRQQQNWQQFSQYQPQMQTSLQQLQQVPQHFLPNQPQFQTHFQQQHQLPNSQRQQLPNQQQQNQLPPNNSLYGLRYRLPSVQQQYAMIHQRLKHPLVYPLLSSLIDEPQPQYLQSVLVNQQHANGLGSASPNALPVTPPCSGRTVSEDQNGADEVPTQRRKRTRGTSVIKPSKHKAVQLNYGETSASQQLNVSTDVNKSLQSGPLSENTTTNSDRSSVYLSPNFDPCQDISKHNSSQSFVEETSAPELTREHAVGVSVTSSSPKESLSSVPSSLEFLPVLNVENVDRVLASISPENETNSNGTSPFDTSSPPVAPVTIQKVNDHTYQILSSPPTTKDKAFCGGMVLRSPETQEVSTTTSDDVIVVDNDEEQCEIDCSICQNAEGLMLHCSGPDCFRSYHLDHHVPEYEQVPSGRFFCSLCIKANDFKSSEDDLPLERRTSRAMTTFERKVCECLLLKLFCHCESLPFHKIENSFYHDDSKVVTPMDFKTIKNKLHNNFYSSVEDFFKDVNQIFIIVYHEAESGSGEKCQIIEKCKAVEHDFLDWVEELIPNMFGFVKLDKITQTALIGNFNG